jgi:2'-5' RNA ligase
MVQLRQAILTPTQRQLTPLLKPHDRGVSSPDAEPVARLFLALWPTPATRRALAEHQARWTWPPGAAVVPAEAMHLTLHFIGPVPANEVPCVAAGLEVGAAPAFEIVFDCAGLWRHGLAVLAASATPPALQALHALLADALRRLQLPLERRPLRPHVTLARKAHGALPPSTQRVSDRMPLVWRSASGHALVQSLPNAEGPRTPGASYRTLRHYP